MELTFDGAVTIKLAVHSRIINKPDYINNIHRLLMYYTQLFKEIHVCIESKRS